MKTRVKTKTESILVVMNILAWVAFVGLLIKTGGILVSFVISTINPEASKNLYEGLDLSAYMNVSIISYTFAVLCKVVFYGLQAYVALLMIKLLNKLNFYKPFSSYVVLHMHIIAYTILGIWVVAMINNIHMAIIDKFYGVNASFISGEFIFIAGIVYVFAQMFKRGVELQHENELTI